MVKTSIISVENTAEINHIKTTLHFENTVEMK